MSAARKIELISVEDYLAGERDSPVKHEYVGGVVYAMAGARNQHGVIAGNTFLAAGIRLKGSRCRLFGPDTKVRIYYLKQYRFYYPDASIVCQENPRDDSFQDRPAVVFEVLSRGTRRIDQGEKKDAYLSLRSLHVYVLIEQDTPSVVVYRRKKDDFVREVYEGLDGVIQLPEVGIDMPLREIYEGVEFQAEPEEE